MYRISRIVVSAALTATVAACGGNAPTPVGGDSGAQKGKFGVFYLVSVARPVGGTIKTADGRLDCGTAGSGHDLCGPVSFDWGVPAVLSAYPDAGLLFQSWAGDCGSAVALSGCRLDTVVDGADKFVAAIFNPSDQLGHARIPSPAQHSPLFFDFVKQVPGTPQCTRCHGATYDGNASAPSCTACHAAAGKPDWLQDCTFCHGSPPTTVPHTPTSTTCSGCHPDTVLAGGTLKPGGKHMNGTADFSEASCGSCHGFPPATGAHLAHFGVTTADLATAAGSVSYGDLGTLETRFPGASPTSAPRAYAFGCGNCHPTDTGRHGDGTLDVDLSPGPAGSLKARNAPGAAFDAASRTCSGAYCHSSGNEVTPTFVTTPSWTSGATLGCAGCHGNPPRYLSGGPGTATANSHFGVNVYGDPWGHVAGLPAPSVGIYKHGGWYGGGSDASMVSCQTCHFDTTDPANTGPSGFYYLDTTLDLDGRSLGGLEGFFACAQCHVEGNPGAPARAGMVLPLRHVNGSRDVQFDARTSLPAFDGLPAAPDRPTKPYWFTVSYGAAEWDRTLVSWTRDPLGGTSGATAQFDLSAARYDPRTKSCTNVACHMSQGSTRFNPAGTGPVDPPLVPLQWGDTYYGNPWTCRKCHALDPSFAY